MQLVQPVACLPNYLLIQLLTHLTTCTVHTAHPKLLNKAPTYSSKKLRYLHTKKKHKCAILSSGLFKHNTITIIETQKSTYIIEVYIIHCALAVSILAVKRNGKVFSLFWNYSIAKTWETI